MILSRCSNCGQPFVYSFVSFEILPLVEFQLEDDITDSEAMHLIESSAGTNNSAGNNNGGGNIRSLEHYRGVFRFPCVNGIGQWSLYLERR